jgi:hypothetical protein
VEVTGTVSSVVYHLREAAVFVVPLMKGGRTRIKIYEGMAMGKATVSTTVGAEGLDVHHGRDILLEDSPAEFAATISTFLQNEEVRRRYEAEAAATARSTTGPSLRKVLLGPSEHDHAALGKTIPGDPPAAGASVEAARNSPPNSRRAASLL